MLIKRVVVFGGSGFIGGHVVENLLNKGYAVTVADRLSSLGNLTNDLRKVNGKDELVHTVLTDIKDRGMVSDLMFTHDAGINLAGILGTSETIEDPYPSVEANIIGGLNFVQACREHHKPGVQIAVGNHFMNNSYAISKTTAERFALMYNKEHETPVCVVRGLNAYGPRQKHKPVRKIMPNFITRALRGEPIKVYGDGSQIMDMIWVKDLAEVLVRAMESQATYSPVSETYEAGTGIPTTVKQIAELVNKISGNKAGIEYVPMRAGESENAVVLANVDSLKGLGFELISVPHENSSVLSIKGFKRLEDGLEETVKWYRENYHWQED